MEKLLNVIIFFFFDLLALKKGFQFKCITTEEEQEAANLFYQQQGLYFPEEMKSLIQKYKKGTVGFIACYKNVVVGFAQLADPKVINRPFELYGVDEAGECHEIQGLAVKKEFRGRSQFILMGLFKKMFQYSKGNGIRCWNSCGMRRIYLIMRSYCCETKDTPIDFGRIDNPITQYLYQNKIIDTYFTLPVAAVAPGKVILGKFVLSVKKMVMQRTTSHASIGHTGKLVIVK